jgi:RNAse (barnase) inhibitor barstar
MATSTSPFHFGGTALPASPALVADLPAGITTTEALFGELSQRLQFPDYFGANWDALWECIRDLSWLPSGPVVLRHGDVPLADDVSSLKKYLSLLADVSLKRWAQPGQALRDVVIVFPPVAEEKIAWLLRTVTRDEEKPI